MACVATDLHFSPENAPNRPDSAAADSLNLNPGTGPSAADRLPERPTHPGQAPALPLTPPVPFVAVSQASQRPSADGIRPAEARLSPPGNRPGCPQVWLGVPPHVSRKFHGGYQRGTSYCLDTCGPEERKQLPIRGICGGISVALSESPFLPSQGSCRPTGDQAPAAMINSASYRPCNQLGRYFTAITCS